MRFSRDAKEPTENISAIWTAYHDERADSLGTVIPGDALVDLRKKAEKWYAARVGASLPSPTATAIATMPPQ